MWYPVVHGKFADALLQTQPWTMQQLINLIERLLQEPCQPFLETDCKSVLGAKAELLLMSLISAKLLYFKPYSGLQFRSDRYQDEQQVLTPKSLLLKSAVTIPDFICQDRTLLCLII